MKNILVVKTAALGDVLRTTVILEGLVEKWVNPKIYWITSKGAGIFLENNPFIEEVYYDTHLPKELFSRKYDLVISLEESSELLKQVQKVQRTKWFGVYWENQLTYTPRSSVWYDMSLISRFGRKTANMLKKSNLYSYPEMLYKMLGLKWSNQRYRLFLNKGELTYASKIKAYLELEKPVIGLVVGSGNRWPMKPLPVDKQIELIKLFNRVFGDTVELLILKGETNFELSTTTEIQKVCPYVKSHAVQSLDQFIGVLKLCDVLITPDTLSMHLGIALTKYVVAYFTVTSAAEIEIYTGGKVITHDYHTYCTYTTDLHTRPNCTDQIDLHDIVDETAKLISQKDSQDLLQ